MRDNTEQCNCLICKRNRMFKRHYENVTTEESRMFFSKLMDVLLQTEEDLQYETDIEVPRLKATIERYEEQLDKANRAMSKWPPAMGRNGRMNVCELVEMLVEELERRDEALTYIALIIHKHQTWTGQGWKQDHIADFEAGKVLAKIHEVREEE